MKKAKRIVTLVVSAIAILALLYFLILFITAWI